MDRRNFLTLLASAPIAALAPLPKVLANRIEDRQLGISIRFVQQWDRYLAPAITGGPVGEAIYGPAYVSLPRTEEEKRATEMVNAARARFLASNAS